MDLCQYFKEPLDSDGLTAHHNEVQERLVRILASHQSEVQCLKRDIQKTRVALLQQRASASGSNGGASGMDMSGIVESLGQKGHHSASASTGAASDASSSWEAVDENEMAKPTLWVPDHAAPACMR